MSLTCASLTLLGLLALQLPLANPAEAAAKQLTGKLTRLNSANTTGSSQQSYWFESNSLRYTDDNKTPYRQGAMMNLFCLDHDLTSPVSRVGGTSNAIKYEIFDPKIHTSAKSSVFESYSNPSKGLAIYNYIFDNYYYSYFAGQAAAKQRAWQMLLWEVAEDYNGSSSSISIDNGVVTKQLFGFSGYNYATQLFGLLKTALSTNAITKDYKSKNKFDINLLHVVDGGKNPTQDMVVYAIAPIPAALPLFGSAIVGIGALAMRRRRNAQAEPATA